jgi:spermidine synthase/MFS family permease
MSARTGKVACLLFGSGACALVYQVAWLRQMRLIFGASTAASAAVLAIFMGGLGLGGVVFGRRADAHPQPLRFYANLELTVAASAALTPALVSLARYVYIVLGGSVALGLGLATVVRLLLATFVLFVPTLAMGGSLPAASKAVETEADVGRRRLAVLYGVNTLGAVTGAFFATFFLLEVCGTRQTLWLACLVNLLVAIAARLLARALPNADQPVTGEEQLLTSVPAAFASRDTVPAPPAFVLAAAALVGFAFFLMELVWYRMLGPLLGGSSFTFGLILSVALLGIGLGGAAYAAFGSDRPATLRGLALTCTAEAICIAYPYALGDRIALLTIFLRALSSLGFYGLVLGWTAVAALVVIPAAFIAGIQFPLIIALLGRGREAVGRHVGLAYAWNTVGSIVGSLAGGFGLLPALSAPGTWRAVVLLLVALAASAMLVGLRTDKRLLPSLFPAAAALVAALLLVTTGPTAAWRHSAIGAGQVGFAKRTPNNLHAFVNATRRGIEWETDGVESSIALSATNGYAFIVNGKIDGNARADAATQVMGGLVGALLVPHPTRAFVVGLGTGSTAGWLGAIPELQRVDVVELEPAVLDVARACAPVNQNVLANPKVNITIGDAREVLLTTGERYDVIFSEPSNPYRAGIASLFTREFYQAVASRLEPGGVFLQWLQTYDVDARTIRSAYATLASVFPTVETWYTLEDDLLLVAAAEPVSYGVPMLRERVEQEPFKTALAVAWRATGIEGFLAHFIARSSLAHAIAKLEGAVVNTDDRSVIEFGFARNLGVNAPFNTREVRDAARARAEDRPQLNGGEVDWGAVEDQRFAQRLTEGLAPEVSPAMTAAQWYRVQALQNYLEGRLDRTLTLWRLQPRGPEGPVELLVITSALASAGDDAALPYLERLRTIEPVESAALLAKLRWRQGKVAEAAAALVDAFRTCQRDPWPTTSLVTDGLNLAVELASKDPELGRQLYAVLKTPFAVRLVDQMRKETVVRLAKELGGEYCVEALQPLEPYVPWRDDFLRDRLHCYEAVHDPRASAAARDVRTYAAAEPMHFADGLGGTTPVR